MASGGGSPSQAGGVSQRGAGSPSHPAIPHLALEAIEPLEAEYESIEAELEGAGSGQEGQPDAAQLARLTKISRRHKELSPVVEALRSYREASADLEVARQMVEESSADERVLARDEVEHAEAALARRAEELRARLVPRDPNDGRNVIMEIRGAEGGEEANLFARDLFEMYSRYAERKGWKLEVLKAEASPQGGYGEVVFVVKGADCWRSLRFEGGPHRVQRVPVTESQGRIHTSAATVTVLPEADEVDVHIDPADLRIDVFRSTGPGGQSVNTTDSAVRITHIPTGIVVSMQDEKSQIQNRAKAMLVLRARLMRAETEKLAAEQSAQRKSQIGSGGRSEKIRTYNFKENRVTDHRVKLTLHKLDRVLAGELDEIVEALVAQAQAEVLVAEGRAGGD